MKQNFESLFISWIATIFIKWLIFFMKWNEILIHYLSWIATKFTLKWFIFFINWNEILIHYFFHGLKWYVHSMYLFENSYSHKILIWMYFFLHEIPFFVKLLTNKIFLKVYQYLLEAFMRNYFYALKSFCIIFNCFESPLKWWVIFITQAKVL